MRRRESNKEASTRAMRTFAEADPSAKLIFVFVKCSLSPPRGSIDIRCDKCGPFRVYVYNRARDPRADRSHLALNCMTDEMLGSLSSVFTGRKPFPRALSPLPRTKEFEVGRSTEMTHPWERSGGREGLWAERLPRPIISIRRGGSLIS
jgi:hypothetical protein